MSDNFDPFDLRGIERKKEQSDERTKLAMQTEADDWKWLMSNKRGRRIVCRLLESCGVYRLSFNHSGSITAFNEGARNIGLMMLAQIHATCPDQYAVMLKEQQDVNGKHADDGRRS